MVFSSSGRNLVPEASFNSPERRCYGEGGIVSGGAEKTVTRGGASGQAGGGWSEIGRSSLHKFFDLQLA